MELQDSLMLRRCLGVLASAGFAGGGARVTRSGIGLNAALKRRSSTVLVGWPPIVTHSEFLSRLWVLPADTGSLRRAQGRLWAASVAAARLGLKPGSYFRVLTRR
jgi:hypothetical protein